MVKKKIEIETIPIEDDTREGVMFEPAQRAFNAVRERADSRDARYRTARDAYERVMQEEWSMRTIVQSARYALTRAERDCIELRADVLINAEDKESGIYTLANATNDRARSAAIKDWEARDPLYLDMLRVRDIRQREVGEAQRDMLICIRAIAALRLDMEYAIACLTREKETT